MRRDRIYPVPIKARTNINRWGDWPDDIEWLLRAWNHRTAHRGRYPHNLTFRRSHSGSIFEPSVHVFKCTDCEAFCEAHPYGAAVLDGDWLCDGCLIARARAIS